MSPERPFSRQSKILALAALIPGAVLLVWAFSGPSPSSTPAKKASSEPAALAWVNDETITERDLFKLLKERHQMRTSHTARSTDFRGLLEKMVGDRLIAQEAVRMELDQEQDVQSRLAQFEDSLVVQLFLKREVKEKIKLAGDEIKNYYNKILERVHPRQIIVKTRKEAKAVLAKLEAGADFSDLAIELSIGPKAKVGGDLGTFPRYSIHPPLEEGVFALKVGEVSQPIPADGNFHIVRMEERFPADPKRYDSMRDRVKRKLRGEREIQQREALLLALRKKGTVEIRNELVEGLSRDMVFDPHAKLSEKPVAVVNESPITLSQLRGRLSRALKLKPVAQNQYPEVRQQVLDKLIGRTLFLEEAYRQGLDGDPTVQKRLAAERREVLKKKFIRHVIWPKIQLTRQDLEAYYREHKERYRMTGRVRLARIVAPSKEEIQKLREKVLAGTDFAWLASHKSKDDEAVVKKGGDLGWISDNMLPPIVRQAVGSLATGSVSQPVPDKGTYHIYYVMGREEGRVAGFDQVVKQVRAEAFRERLELAIAQWVKRLREVSTVRFNEARLQELPGRPQR